MNLIDAFDKLITEHGSAAIQKVHIDLLREQAKALVEENENLKTENSDLKELCAKLTTELKSNARREEFVEHRGMFFKRKQSGGYFEAVYCPHCKGPMGGGFPHFPYQCLKCKVIADFAPQELKMTILPEVVKEYGA